MDRGHCALEDAALLEPFEPPFSPPVMFVCTFEAELDNICRTHEDLIRVLEPAGAVKAINCNYGHKAQPGFERFLKLPAPLPAPEPARDGELAPANVRQRKLQGDGTCFNSAIEAIIIPGPGDDPPPVVQQLLAANPDKHYAVKSFPTTGKTQVPGVLSLGLEDGGYVARLWAQYLSAAGVGARPAEDIRVVAVRPIMQNFKFHLMRRDERIILNLGRLVGHLETVREGAEGVPYPIREIKHAQDNQNISFKFQVAAAKKVRVNIFFRGKVNILGAASSESAQRIYDFLSTLLRRRWAAFVVIQPLSDRERAARRRAQETEKVAPKGPAPSAPRAPPVVPAIDPANVLTDEEMDSLLGVCEPPPAVPAIDTAAVLALAASFERGASDDAAFDKVDGEGIEDDHEDALDDDPERGGRATLHAAPEPRDDVICEDVADHQDEYDEHRD